MKANEQNRNEPWLHRFAVLTAIITFLLLGIGGLVTSNEAGMSVPDWPTSYGYNMFALPIKFWHGGAFFEHTHRLLASGAGLLTTILTLWLFGKNARPFMHSMVFFLPIIGIVSEILFPNRWLDGVLYGAIGVLFYVASFFWPRCKCSAKWMRWLGVIAFLLVVAQGVLGGLRVTMKMDSLGIYHGVVAQSYFVLMCAIALFTSWFWHNLNPVAAVYDSRSETNATVTDRRYKILRRLALATTLLIFIQLILGATMRHQHAGLAIPDFPLAYGKIWPNTSAAAVASYNAKRVEAISVNPITAFQIELQMVHRIVAVLILIAVVACAWMARVIPFYRRISIFWLALIVAQIALGAWTIWSNKAADVATLHVMIGALSLVTGALWCIIAFRRPESLTEIAPSKTISGTFGASLAMATNK